MTTLLALPNELLFKIASLVAPNGGRKARHLSLVCRHFATIVAPITWSQIIVPEDYDGQDELLSALIDTASGRASRVTSLHLPITYGGTPRPIKSWAAVLKLLPNLERLHISGVSKQEYMPTPIQLAIASLPRLTTLRFERLILAKCMRLVDWAPTVKSIEAKNCRGYNVFYFGEDGTVGGIVKANLKNVYVDRVATEEESRTRGLVYTLAAGVDTLEELEFHATELIEEPLKGDLFLGIDFENMKLRKLSILGLEDSLIVPTTPTHSALVDLLQHIGHSPLAELHLCVPIDFRIHPTLTPLFSMPNLTTLHLKTDIDSEDHDVDLLTSSGFTSLAYLLSPKSFPSLRTLRLTGWFEASSVLAIASNAVSDMKSTVSAFDPIGLYALLHFLLATTVTRLELADLVIPFLDGEHLDVNKKECLFWREEDGKGWDRRLVTFI